MRAEPNDEIFSPCDGECKDIVRYVAPADGDTVQPGSDGVEDRRHVVRAIQSSKLAWELMDISQDLPVRHGQHDGEHSVFVQIADEQGNMNWVAADDERLRRHLRTEAYKRLCRGPSKGVVDEVVAHIEARGFSLPAEPMSRRVYWDRESLWICLGPGSQRAVQVTKVGWTITDSPPVIFRPAGNAETFPDPVRGGSIESLRKFFPSVTEESWPSLVGFVVATFLPEGGLPLLCITGPENVGKSTATELIRWLCDPVVGLDARTALPNKPEDLFTLASTAHVLSLENLSKIRGDMADALCTVLTGAAHASRKLYSQGVAHILRARNPIVMNGITASPERPDLLSRCVVVELQEIPEERRRGEVSIRREFHQELPGIMGAIFDALVMAIRDMESTVVAPSHRLADAAQFVTAAEPALGLPDGSIVSAWLSAQAGAQVDLCSSDPVADVLARIFKRDKIESWRGTASDLSKAAAALEKDGQELPPDFPREANRLGDHCKRRSTVIRRAGFKVNRVRTAAARFLEITRQPPDPISPAVSVKRPSQSQSESGGGST